MRLSSVFVCGETRWHRKRLERSNMNVYTKVNGSRWLLHVYCYMLEHVRHYLFFFYPLCKTHYYLLFEKGTTKTVRRKWNHALRFAFNFINSNSEGILRQFEYWVRARKSHLNLVNRWKLLPNSLLHHLEVNKHGSWVLNTQNLSQNVKSQKDSFVCFKCFEIIWSCLRINSMLIF